MTRTIHPFTLEQRVSETDAIREGLYVFDHAAHEWAPAERGIMERHMADVWVRKCGSFEDDRRADREFWRSVPPDARVAAVEDLRKQWARFQGADDEGLRRTVRVLEAPER